uniref:hypothetical protein n=1 Tax=Kingella oralis TaxID=505 RepID=UPI0034E39AFC
FMVIPFMVIPFMVIPFMVNNRLKPCIRNHYRYFTACCADVFAVQTRGGIFRLPLPIAAACSASFKTLAPP